MKAAFKRPAVLLITGTLLILASLNMRWVAYLAHLTSHQLRVVLFKEKIDERLKRSDISQAEKRSLGVALKIRAFAETAYGIKNSRSYTYFFPLDRPTLGYNITAAPALSLKPESFHFWPIGSFDYLGFFDKEYALRWANEYRAKGLDVHLSEIAGYSTLGWFADPLYSSQLLWEEEHLAALIAHEIAHERLYVKGDTAFSESLASFIGEKLAADYLRSSGKRVTVTAKEREMRYAQFSDLVLSLRKSLEELYESRMSDEEKLGKKKFLIQKFTDRLKESRKYLGLTRIPEINNAYLAQFHRYDPKNRAFESLFDRCLKSAASSVYECWFKNLEKLVHCSSDFRKNWLESYGDVNTQACKED